MNGQQLENCLKSDRYTSPYFKGVFPSDLLVKQKIDSFPCGLIANTDPSNKPGEHWVAFYFDSDGKGEYFDSYGAKPKSKRFKSFLNKNSKGKYIWNSVPLQSPFSSTCGQFCLFFMTFRARNLSMQEISGFFSKDKALNDVEVNEFISTYFDINTKVSDVSFMINQISRAIYNTN